MAVFDNAKLRKTCTLEADDCAAFSQAASKFALKTTHRCVAHSMQEVSCLDNCDCCRDRKTALVFSGVAHAAFTPVPSLGEHINERLMMKTQSHPFTVQKQNWNRAFTLVEMLLVVTIIGILAALVIPKIIGRGDQARFISTNADVMGGISSALNIYEVDNGVFPKSLQDLIQQPEDARNWRGPYLGKLPVDRWGHPYIYYYPGKQNQKSFDLLSIGPDGQEGTADDIGNWQG
jgi:general secretion pathway protein G